MVFREPEDWLLNALVSCSTPGVQSECGVLAGVPATAQAFLPAGSSRYCPPTKLMPSLQVWTLSDIDKDGHLDRDEFVW